jgi:hypothetical protein
MARGHIKRCIRLRRKTRSNRSAWIADRAALPRICRCSRWDRLGNKTGWEHQVSVFHATTKSATSEFTSPALAAKKANQKNLRPTSRNSPKHNVLDALIRSENANWRNNAKQDHLGVKRKIAGGSNSTKVLFGRLRTEDREKQDRTEKGIKTHPAFASGTTGTCWFL